MAWQSITADDIFPRQAELETVRDIVLHDGSTGAEMLADAIAQEVKTATGYLRAAVAKGYLNALGPAATVPESLVGPLSLIIRRAALGRLPGLESLHGQIREDEVKSAESFLRGVGTGIVRVEEHGDSAPEPSAPSPQTTARTRTFRREDAEGL
jgi:hypothetical protein